MHILIQNHSSGDIVGSGKVSLFLLSLGISVPASTPFGNKSALNKFKFKTSTENRWSGLASCSTLRWQGWYE